MNIITLRDIGTTEIHDSFRGILRISPNEGVDDPTPLLSVVGSRVQLSTSEGTLLPITFVTKSALCKVVGRSTSKVDLINVVHEYENLNITKSLNIRPTLYLEPSGAKVPLILVNGSTSVGYPLEAPDNEAYFNHSNKFGFDKNLSLEENISKNLSKAEYDTIPESEKVTINGAPVYRYIQPGDEPIRVQDFQTRTAILGVYPGNTYTRSKSISSVHDLRDEDKYSSSGVHTQFSYLPLDKMIWENLQTDLGGIYRSTSGRYFNLSNGSSNELAKKLFGNDITPEKLEEKGTALILGVPVQSGTIHYNAIPAHRYFFHCARRYDNSSRKSATANSTNITEANRSLNNVMNNLTRQYVLCDGKEITTDYPNIDRAGLVALGWTSTHRAIGTTISGDANKFKTPPLFECDQFAPRFLRGLNWLRDSNGNLISNTLTYNKVGDKNDAANHKKVIDQVGMYYANYDYDFHKRYEHAHMLFANKPIELFSDSSSTVIDELLNEKKMFQGKVDSEVPENINAWAEYVNGTPTYWNSGGSFFKSYILKTIGGLKKVGYSFSGNTIKKLQSAPIINNGGSNSVFHKLMGCLRAGKRKLGKCRKSKNYCDEYMLIKDGGYIMAPDYEKYEGYVGTWRFTSSLPVRNKYGKPDTLEDVLSYSETNGGVKTYLDDTLPSPPTMNFIPLMKI